jgi:hypothetical protein
MFGDAALADAEVATHVDGPHAMPEHRPHGSSRRPSAW